MSRDDLRAQVETFADGLSETLRAVLGGDLPSLTATEDAESRFGVTTTDPSGFTLTRDGEPFLTLRVRFTCGWDGPQTFTRVTRSEVHLYPHGITRPVIRYEYESGSTRSLPSAHVHVHTDDPHVVDLLATSGTSTLRARRNAHKAAKGKAQPADLHLPLGGSRFRPALEDVLHMVVNEFGVDAAEGWQQHLADGREGWRRIQTRAVTRDAPEEAAEALRALGYEVSPPPAGAPDDNRARLREP